MLTSPDTHKQVSNRSAIVASLVYHAFIILGEIGLVYTIVRGITAWTIYTALLFFLAGLLTLVYPHVGSDRRFTRWVWGQPSRSLIPWLALIMLLLTCLLYGIQ